MAKHEEAALEIYRARLGTQAIEVFGPGVPSAFTIEVRFKGGLNKTQKKAFKGAADRWTKIIIGDLPAVRVDGETIDDLVIEAQGVGIDGPSGILGQAGPTHVRGTSSGAQAFLPAKGVMSFDTADLLEMEHNGTLNDVITHEMGHVLGIGTAWEDKNLLQGAGGSNPVFIGASAMREYGALRGMAGSAQVPVENSGGGGTRDSHWRETIFKNELMSGFISAPGNPISRMTVASLEDIGYVVDYAGAEPYALVDLFALAEAGELVPHAAPIAGGHMLPTIPFVLPAP
jgi:hypothetical protein